MPRRRHQLDSGKPSYRASCVHSFKFVKAPGDVRKACREGTAPNPEQLGLSDADLTEAAKLFISSYPRRLIDANHKSRFVGALENAKELLKYPGDFTGTDHYSRRWGRLDKAILERVVRLIESGQV
jgi:hypothetical protein